MSKDISKVQTGISKQALMGGGTEFASPLSMCHTTITTQATGEGQENGTKQFCVLISDGAPNEKLGRKESATIDEFCKNQSLSGTCGTKQVYDWMTGGTNEVPIDCCSSQNIMYRIKKLGYIIIGIYVEAPGSYSFITDGSRKKMKLYASCETSGEYGKDNEYKPLERFHNDETNATHLTNYDDEGNCLYYADATSMDDLQVKIGQIADNMIKTTKAVTKTTDAAYGAKVRKYCPKTCGSCPTAAPSVAPRGCRMSLAGNPRWLKRHQAQCTRQDEKLYVRCCSSSGAKVPMRTYGCNAGKTYAEATAICSGRGFRLCTQQEIMAGKTSGTGCGYDFKRVWTSTAAKDSARKLA